MSRDFSEWTILTEGADYDELREVFNAIGERHHAAELAEQAIHAATAHLVVVIDRAAEVLAAATKEAVALELMDDLRERLRAIAADVGWLASQ